MKAQDNNNFKSFEMLMPAISIKSARENVDDFLNHYKKDIPKKDLKEIKYLLSIARNIEFTANLMYDKIEYEISMLGDGGFKTGGFRSFIDIKHIKRNIKWTKRNQQL